MTRMMQRYQAEVIPAMMKEFGYKNPMAVPRIRKVVVHMGVGRAIENEKRMTEASEALGKITGQKAKICKAKAPISGFRLRKGQAIGCLVTVRGKRMYEFLDRLISVAIPRIKDFRGLSPKSFDGQGNYNFGIDEQIVFPEVPAASAEFMQGMDISISVSNSSDEESLRMLTALGMPFARKK
ncbi:MAG: 50S ribosomal protein L5 [Planctomycetes bacterium]|nr:50S ribosomal protein L5 [Planctomycetota bacterium]